MQSAALSTRSARAAAPSSRRALVAATSAPRRHPVHQLALRGSPTALRAAQDPETPPAEPAPEASAPSEAPAAAEPEDTTPEKVLYEGSGSNAELIFSIAMLPTVLYAPLSLQSIGRKAWISYRITNKRVTVRNTSPLFSSETSFPISAIKSILVAPRAFSMWYDMAIVLRDGRRLEILGMDNAPDLKRSIEACIPGNAL